MMIARGHCLLAATLSSLLLMGDSPRAQAQSRVQFPDSRYDVAAARGFGDPSVPGSMPPPAASFDPYSIPPPATPLARFFGVAQAQAYGPAPAQTYGPVMQPGTALGQPVGAAPYYAFQAPPVAYGPPAPVLPMAPGVQGAGCFRPGPYAEFGAVFLDRDDRVNSQAILIDDNPPLNTDNNLFRAEQGDFNYEVGPRVLVGYDFNQRVAYELLYFGIYSWDWATTVSALNDVNVVGDLGLVPALDFFNADSVAISLDSTFHNLEINRIGSFSPCVAWLLGFRYVRLTEDFSLAATDNGIAPPPVSRYDVDVTNNLYGGQLGLRLRQVYGDFSLDLLGKAGIYANSAEQTTFVGTDAGFVLRDSETSATEAAFVGDLTLTGRYHISTSVALQAGYQVMFLEGVALATDQLDFTNTPTSGEALNIDGSVFIHGAHAGLLVVW